MKISGLEYFSLFIYYFIIGLLACIPFLIGAIIAFPLRMIFNGFYYVWKGKFLP